MRQVCLAAVLLVCLVSPAWGHGRLWDPPSRSSLWRFGYNSPTNYNDNELSCGGFQRQHEQNGGRCGVCGDPWDGVRANEAGGRYANGIISKVYQTSQVIEIVIDVTANHRGWFEFNLCPVNDPSVRATQDCFDRYLLQQADGSGPRWTLRSSQNIKFSLYYQLPAGLRCSQCVLQWRWVTGNSWGIDPDTGRGCIGCGPQENFRGCSDIAIGSDPVSPIPTSPTTRGPSTNSPPASTNPTTSPPAPTPSPWPTRIQGVRCRAIGSWAGNPALDRWCNNNCNNFPPHCPEQSCECWMEP